MIFCQLNISALSKCKYVFHIHILSCMLSVFYATNCVSINVLACCLLCFVIWFMSHRLRDWLQCIVQTIPLVDWNHLEIKYGSSVIKK